MPFPFTLLDTAAVSAARAPDRRDLDAIHADLLSEAEAGRHLQVVDQMACLVTRRGPGISAALASRVARGGALRAEHLDTADRLAELRTYRAKRQDLRVPQAEVAFFESLSRLSPRHADAWFWLNQGALGRTSFRGVFVTFRDLVLPRLAPDEYRATTQRLLEAVQPKPGDLLAETMYRELLSSVDQQRALTYAGCLLGAARERSGP